MTASAEGASPGTDAWTFALEVSRPYFAAPAARELPIEFAAEANGLGKVLRAFHEALAGDDSDESGQEPALPEDLDGWIDCARASVEAGLTLLDRQLSTGEFVKTRVAEAQALVKRRTAYLARVDELADSLGDDLGMRIGTNGNMSLGAIGRGLDGNFTIVAGNSTERTSPLRDVASILRSIGYASATLVAGVEKTSDLATRELRAGRWERDVRAGFLEGYTVESDDDAPGILPEGSDSTTALTALFEVEKAFGDLSSELTNRPSWVWIPMRGIAKLLTR